VSAAAPWAVYVHVPFCGRRCGYCDFATEALPPHAAERADRLARYVDSLLAEIDSAEARPADTVFFGGGTPTQLSARQLLAILDRLRARGGILPAAEITIEANPTTAEAAKFAALRAGGVNRLSLGVQSLHDDLLAGLGRSHSAAEAVAAYRLARSVGFANVSLDLMFNLPGQSLADWREDLRRVAELGPEHLSLYSLTVEDGTPLARQVAEGRVTLPNEETDAAMFEAAIDDLASLGYEHYEISNFARPGCRCVHNQVYWRNEEYRGFGPGAASYVGRRRWLNQARPERWGEALEAGVEPVAESEVRDEDGERRETMFLGLRLRDGVEAEAYRRRYGAPPEEFFGPELAKLAAEGLVELWHGCWRLTRRGVMLANRVFVEFV
jgi:oxygen-independent coproporphyrinogen-3 oxidase